MHPDWVYVDFMRLHEGGLAFLSADGQVENIGKEVILLEEGMPLTVCDSVCDEDCGFATGVVVKAPYSARPDIPFFWFLKIDSKGIRNANDEREEA